MTSVRTGRATVNAFLAMLSATLGLATIGGLLGLSAAAMFSLVTSPTGGWGLIALYVVVVVSLPVTLLWAVGALSVLQRRRVHVALGLDVPAPPRRTPWLIGPWRCADTWRQLGFHIAAVGIDGVGGAVVVICWTGVVLAVAFGLSQHPPALVLVAALALAAMLLLAAPWLARRHAGTSAALASALLGPSRSDQLAMQVETLARSRADIVMATDAERRRIERDLHDGAQQRLVSLAMNLGSARTNLSDITDPARQAIADAHDEAVLALSEMRAFIRGLHPAVLNDRGLDAALSGLVSHAPLPVRLTVDVAVRTSPSVEAIAYFIVSESLTNIAKYAEATSAEVTVTRAGDLLRIVIVDNGRGGAEPTASGTGLTGLTQRAASVDGTLTIHSPQGGPTTIVAELPCES